MAIRRVCLILSLFGWSLLGGCDDETAGQGGDCRQERLRCVDGFACVNSGGTWDCLQQRDSGLERDVITLDAQAFDGTTAPTDTAVSPLDSAPSELDGAMTEDVFTSPVDDVGVILDMSVEQLDMMRQPIDARIVDADQPVVDAQAPAADAQPPQPDAGDLEDDGGAFAVDMAGPDPAFGPGRCNHQRRLDVDDEYEPNPDQNSARRLLPGRYPDLVLRAGDSDWYRLDGLCANGVVSFILDHPFDGGDIDLQVWANGEGRVIQSQGFCTGREEGRYQLPDGVDTLTVGVYGFGPPGQPAGANTYSLTVLLACRD